MVSLPCGNELRLEAVLWRLFGLTQKTRECVPRFVTISSNESGHESNSILPRGALARAPLPFWDASLARTIYKKRRPMGRPQLTRLKEREGEIHNLRVLRG